MECSPRRICYPNPMQRTCQQASSTALPMRLNRGALNFSRCCLVKTTSTPSPFSPPTGKLREIRPASDSLICVETQQILSSRIYYQYENNSHESVQARKHGRQRTLANSAILFKFVNMLGCFQSTAARYVFVSQSTTTLSKSSPPARVYAHSQTHVKIELPHSRYPLEPNIRAGVIVHCRLCSSNGWDLPRLASPPVERTSMVPPPTSKMDTSNVPPPRSSTSITSSSVALIPYANAAATGSLQIWSQCEVHRTTHKDIAICKKWSSLLYSI